ncbi:MAG: hypothetical protein A3E37_00480 [Candidatus Andersenbacteria bacterium RIFCSPHIGHO2_12_FULL_46_9]|nr:MAG: Cell shape-determining protein MreC [Parcubacteria group bacterium GW2011_GWA2_45_14]OGY34788.1 MAG: hypothetical protein A3B76_00275 [Candidatus Andersenbacteria bacterium RIFCSPHIGHO2_02_FULL_46_16]OGY35922.1 MAG: hypothetical protein A3E37_00480 [Candidatus Andersenbacteria bacterium RIFCSPHIGHO2_12_FULL_46_9]OGY38143.1 MAG: hypothetical protein A3I08_04065 [Candidatus Andersenbacteria bacterium RIFCSPLOWO2_02_FULL_46_11]OGY40148.1 MAG: hypothetical protein A3G57_00030 [Candidatus An
MTKRSKVYLVILVVIVLGLLWLQTPLMTTARNLTWGSWVSVIGRIWQIGPLTVPNNVAEQMGTLVAENARLKAECRDYQAIIKQLGSTDREGFREVPARVAAQPIDTYHSQLIINRGAQDGLVLGSPAVIQSSLVVGFISQLFEKTAVLQLLSSPQSTFPAEVLADETMGKGLVQGKSYTSVEMITIPRDVALHPGQEVVTAAQEGLVPYGLLVGHIRESKDEQHDPYQRARLQLSYDTSELKAVTVLVAP